jgi:hypothetical protein
VCEILQNGCDSMFMQESENHLRILAFDDLEMQYSDNFLLNNRNIFS